MSSVRHQQALKAFLDSPEANQPLALNPLHDHTPTAPSSTRELQEAKERLARPDDLEGIGRQGCVPVGGSIAFESARLKQKASAPAIDPKARQAAVIAALEGMQATQLEFAELRGQLKNMPLVKLMEVQTWTSTLEKLRKFRRGVFV